MKKYLSIIGLSALAVFSVSSCRSDSSSGDSSSSSGSSSGSGSSSSSYSIMGTAATTTSCSGSGLTNLLCIASAFQASLSTSQLATLQQSYTYSNIKTWSNLPAGMSSRLGLKLGDLSTTQLGLAKALVKEICGSTTNEGWDEMNQLWLADDYLYSNGGGSTYGSANYYLAFFGTPSTSGTFEILFTGHHKTIQVTYKNGVFASATPQFLGVEPLSFTTSGTTYTAMATEQAAFAAILAGLDSTQLTTAKSSSTFTDLLLGPSANWSFPTAYSGLKCSSLTTAQKQLVLNAIKTYVYDVDDTNAATIFATYSSEIDNTYILYSGTSALTSKNDYIRIDGPHVWIEFSVQGGIVLSGVHYHSVWRDRVNDYAGTTN